MIKIIEKNILFWYGYDKYTCVLLIYGWCDYSYELFITFVYGYPELKLSRVSNTAVLEENELGYKQASFIVNLF